MLLLWSVNSRIVFENQVSKSAAQETCIKCHKIQTLIAISPKTRHALTSYSQWLIRTTVWCDVTSALKCGCHPCLLVHIDRCFVHHSRERHTETETYRERETERIWVKVLRSVTEQGELSCCVKQQTTKSQVSSSWFAETSNFHCNNMQKNPLL